MRFLNACQPVRSSALTSLPVLTDWPAPEPGRPSSSGLAIQGLSQPGVLLWAIVLGAGWGILRCKPQARSLPAVGERSVGLFAAAGELPVSSSGVNVPRPVELDSRISRGCDGPGSVEIEDECGRRRPSFRRRVKGNHRCSPSGLLSDAIDRTSTLDAGLEPESWWCSWCTEFVGESGSSLAHATIIQT